MDANIQTMMSLAQQRPLAAQPRPTLDQARADKASKDYEQVFISQFLGSMFSGIATDGVTGGGEGEQMFRSLMIDQYAKGIEAQGGFGIAAQMKAELLKHQQAPVQPETVQ
ncbi:MAG TPA: rod-binding protein [Rhizomicrobium sp.]|nr:rod-binding protein [Rhizomicrobium sp.]